MGTKYPDLFADLAEAWPDAEVELLTKGKATFGYLRADQVMTRLDQVLGPENWWADFERDQMGSEAVKCRLTIRLPDGSTITKADLGAPAEMKDKGDAEKSAASDALKRAAVHFGIGRWLRGPVAPFVDEALSRPRGSAPAPAEPPPPIPPPAPAPAPARFPRMVEPPRKTSSHSASPKTGRELWAWAGDTGPLHDTDLRAFLAQVGEQSGYPHLVIKWNAAQVAHGLKAAVVHLRQLAGQGDAYEPEDAAMAAPARSS